MAWRIGVINTLSSSLILFTRTALSVMKVESKHKHIENQIGAKISNANKALTIPHRSEEGQSSNIKGECRGKKSVAWREFWMINGFSIFNPTTVRKT